MLVIILILLIFTALILFLGFIYHNQNRFSPKVKNFFNKLLRYFLNWRFLVCFLIGWMITNGWCYLFIFFGSIFKISWMRNVGIGYAAILWLPGTPEKIITFGIAIALRKILFPKDKKLAEMMEKEKKLATKNDKKKDK